MMSKSSCKVILLMSVCFVMTIIAEDGLTLEKVTAAECPDAQKQFKCLPYGGCYGFDSFCNPVDKAVQPCFEDNILADRKTLLNLCREAVKGNLSFLPHPSCRFACYTRFNITELSNVETGNTYDWQLATFILLGVTGVLMILSIFLIYKSRIFQNVIRRLCCAKRRKSLAVRMSELPKDEEENKENGITDQASTPQGHAANDVTVNLQGHDALQSQQTSQERQPLLDDVSQASRVDVRDDHFQCRSANSASTAQSTNQPNNSSASSSSFSLAGDSGNISDASGQIGHALAGNQTTSKLLTSPTIPDVGGSELVTSKSPFYRQ